MEKLCELFGYSINQKECDVTKDMDFHECEMCEEKKPMKKEKKDTAPPKVGGEPKSGKGKRKYTRRAVPANPALPKTGGEQDVQQMIANVCDELKVMLLEKNRKYGNSALNPVRVFSTADPYEQINVRIDDKLSRLKAAQVDEDEDVVQDLIGYLILRTVARRMA